MLKVINICLLFIVLNGIAANAQESHLITVDGKVKSPLTIDLPSLSKLPVISIDSLEIFNHLMQKKSTITKLKGIPLSVALSKLEIDELSPRKLSEYYFVCTAADNYKVVLSWNEIFNSKNDSNLMLLLNFEPNPRKAEKGNIALIAPGDKASGRRFVKGLTKITVLHAE